MATTIELRLHVILEFKLKNAFAIFETKHFLTSHKTNILL